MVWLITSKFDKTCNIHSFLLIHERKHAVWFYVSRDRYLTPRFWFLIWKSIFCNCIIHSNLSFCSIYTNKTSCFHTNNHYLEMKSLLNLFIFRYQAEMVPSHHILCSSYHVSSLSGNFNDALSDGEQNNPHNLLHSCVDSKFSYEFYKDLPFSHAVLLNPFMQRTQPAIWPRNSLHCCIYK